MKNRPVAQAIAAIILMLAGAVCAFLPMHRYDEHRVIANAGSCRVDMLIVQKKGVPAGPEIGTVILFHGLSANKLIMTYLARAFAEVGLIVYMPDFPGHGRTAGPFTAQTAESCGLSLVRGLAARGLIIPDRTILAGHSMGAAIALRIAPAFRPAGVIAISPAPMIAAHGIEPEQLIFSPPPAIRANTLITAGEWEPPGLLKNAEDLATNAKDTTVLFEFLPHHSHVSVLLSPYVAHLAQDWAAQVLHLANSGTLPSLLPAVGCVLGLAGLLLIAPPFLREMTGKDDPTPEPVTQLPGTFRLIVEITLASLAVVFVLRYFVPLRFMRLFEGDYLASFFLLLGFILLLLHPKLANSEFSGRPAALLGAAFAALLVHLLLTGWFELTFSGAWLTWQKWTRFPLFFFAAFVFFYALEVLLGPIGQRPKRLLVDYLALLLAWHSLVLAAFHMHSGEVLMVLLLPYFVLFFLFSRAGAQLVRERTSSAPAAAIFGAILFAGFSLVLFPVS